MKTPHYCAGHEPQQGLSCAQASHECKGHEGECHKVMRLCRHCAELAREKKFEESPPLMVKTSEDEILLEKLPYDFAMHLSQNGVGWGQCDSCKRRQWPNPRGPLHHNANAPLAYFKGEPKKLQRLYTIAARVEVNGEWRPFLEHVTALSIEDAKRKWRSQFLGHGNFKPHVIDACGPTLGFTVDEEADKDGKVLIA